MLNFHEFGLRESERPGKPCAGSPGDGMVKVHNNTIRRKWKEGLRGERVAEEEGEILKGERREERREGLMGNYIWRLVAAGGKWTD